MKSRLVSIGVPTDKITVVENYVDVDRFLSYPVDRTSGDARLGNRFLIVHVGVLGRTRGLDVAVRAMSGRPRAVPEAVDALRRRWPHARGSWSDSP